MKMVKDKEILGGADFAGFPLKEAEIRKWQDLKFGMFIHWGLYSVMKRGEWAMYNDGIDKDEYAKLADQFTAKHFSAEYWAEVAKKAGMKYMVFTARHHDGFSLFDSKHSMDDFTVMKTPAKRDIVGEYTKACREAGLKVGIYYSPMDWRSPATYMPLTFRKEGEKLRNQCHKQVEELMNNYGKIDIMWYDGGEDFILGFYIPRHVLEEDMLTYKSNPFIPNFWHAEELNEKVRHWQPGIVINERFGDWLQGGTTRGVGFGDFTGSEKKIGNFNIDIPWETCDTLGTSWGWIDDDITKSFRQIIEILVRTVTGGGNLLLNVAPDGEGRFAEEQVERLYEVGEWLSKYGESIYETQGGPLPNGQWGGTTYKGNILYVHVLEWNKKSIPIPKGSGNVISVSALTCEEFSCSERENSIELTVPVNSRQNADTIFKIEFDKPISEIYKKTESSLFENDFSDRAVNLGEL